MTEENSNTVGGARSVSVAITLNGKSLGVDAFIKLEQTHEFLEPVEEYAAYQKRNEIAEILTDQALDIVGTTVDKVQKYAAENPRGHVSIHKVSPAAPAGAQAGQTIAGAGPDAVRAVANGASFQSDWRTAPSKFGDGDIRFLSTASYPTVQLETEVRAWLTARGFDPALFKIWDNRPGARGLEAGVPNGSVANIKVDDAAQAAVPAEFGRVPAARVKFNNDGSLYVWFTKEFEAASKYGAVDPLKLGA